jgi:hypothetical protein
LFSLLVESDFTHEGMLILGLLLSIPLLALFVAIGSALAACTVPVKVRRYSALDGTIEVRFHSAECAEKFVASIRAWEKRIQQGSAHP